MAVESKKSGLARRIKRKAKLRQRVRGTDSKPRVCVYRSDKHIYAQLISDESRRTLAVASSCEQEVLGQIPAAKEGGKVQARSSKSVLAAEQVGLAIGKRAKEKGFSKVVFDRNGYLYHGRVKAVADGARKAGLEF